MRQPNLPYASPQLYQIRIIKSRPVLAPRVVPLRRTIMVAIGGDRTPRPLPPWSTESLNLA